MARKVLHPMIDLIDLSSGSDDEVEVVASPVVRKNWNPVIDEVVFTGSVSKRRASQAFGQAIGAGDDIIFGSPINGKNQHANLSTAVITKRAQVAAALTAQYGEDDSGWGVKVTSVEGAPQPVIKSLALSISPRLPTSHKGLPDSFLVTVFAGPSKETDHPLISAEFHAFPPVRVRIDFVCGAVSFSVSCPWLVKRFIKRLTMEMQQIYDQKEDVLAAIGFLELNGIACLDIVRDGRVCYTTPDVLVKRQSDIIFADPEAVLEYYEKANTIFQLVRGTVLETSAVFDCPICYDHKPSMTAVVFPGCRHFFCKACASQDLALKVAEGQIKNLTCLERGCRSVASVDMMKELVDKPVFLRYCFLMSEDFVDGRDNIIRCPRKECSAPMELELGGEAPRDLRCLTCKYQFCKACKAASHKGSPCLSDEQKKKIRQEWDAADTAGRETLKKTYGAENVRVALEDAQSEEWIGKNTKPCPKCATPIEKNNGCNKIVCTAKGCGSFFCWLCLEVLQKENPYVHFNATAGGKCGGLLYQQVAADGAVLPPGPAPQHPFYQGMAAAAMRAMGMQRMQPPRLVPVNLARLPRPARYGPPLVIPLPGLRAPVFAPAARLLAARPPGPVQRNVHVGPVHRAAARNEAEEQAVQERLRTLRVRRNDGNRGLWGRGRGGGGTAL